MDSVRVELRDRISIVRLARPQVRNAVDGATARALADAFRDFDANPDSDVAILHGEYGTFCAGADLKAVAAEQGGNRLSAQGDAPMGPSRMVLGKPVIAAIAGHAVAGGLELALWCDLRVVERSAVMGVYCRRWGVPLIDGGTVRLPRLIGHSRAMDLILTGRAVDAEEALQIGLANRLVEDGDALAGQNLEDADVGHAPDAATTQGQAQPFTLRARRHGFPHRSSATSSRFRSCKRRAEGRPVCQSQSRRR